MKVNEIKIYLITDITERKHAEKKLREKDEKLEQQRLHRDGVFRQLKYFASWYYP